MSEHLLPCPFCNGSHVTDRYVRDGRQMFCINCGASVAPSYHGPNNDTLERASEAWNRRASFDPHEEYEHFLAAAIDRSPEQLRQLGEYLSNVLDEDQFPRADRLLLGIAEAFSAMLAALKQAKRLTDNMNEFGACTDSETYDAAWSAVEAAISKAEQKP